MITFLLVLYFILSVLQLIRWLVFRSNVKAAQRWAERHTEGN